MRGSLAAVIFCCLGLSRGAELGDIVQKGGLVGGLLAELASWAPPPSPPHGVSTVFKAGELGYNVFRIPAVVRTASGVLLAFSEAREHGGDFDHIDLVQRRSLDGGRTWGNILIVVGNRSAAGFTDHGQPTPVFDRDTGKVVLVWCLNNTFVLVTTSADDGVTWSPSRDITAEVKRPGWGWYATGPNHAVQLRSGRLVVPFNSFFEDSEVVTRTRQTGCMNVGECARYQDPASRSLTTTIEITNPKDPAMAPLRAAKNGTAQLPIYVWAGDRSGIFYSDDHGESWRLGGMVDSRLGSSECAAAETEDGLLVLSFRVEDPDTHCRKMAMSRDGGETFETFFEPAGACIPDPTCQGSIVQLDDGRLVTSGPAVKTGRKGMLLSIGGAPSTVSDGVAAATTAKPLEFQALVTVFNSSYGSGYSDVVALPAAVGVISEFSGSLVWAETPVPPAPALTAPASPPSQAAASILV